MAEQKQRAPTLYVIIGIKLVKGLFFVFLAMGVFKLVGHDLPAELEKLAVWFRLDPETEFFNGLEERVARITPANIRWVASGALLYGLLSLGEAVGLVLRVSWVGWLVACESALFIPYEVFKLAHGFSVIVCAILLLNIWIVWYLVRNRHRLFRHHH